MKLVDPSSTGIRFDKILKDGYAATCEVDIVAHIFSLLGCDIYHHPEEEADDLIASFCKSHPDSIRVIVSADKDFFQLLVDPRVACYVPGLDGDRFFDADKSTQHWARMNNGKHPAIPPAHVRMFKALCGDSSDGIHGVDRLRKKVAAALCHHKSIDDLYSSGLPGMSASEREKSFALRDRVTLNYDLVGFDNEINLPKFLREAGRQDFQIALDIIRQDFGMLSIDIAPFRTGTQIAPSIAPSIPESIPMDSWLSDI